MSTAAACSNSIADLAGDTWFEIFLRLPLALIFEFRCVSKIWCSILSSPSFINSWVQLHDSSLPWGFVVSVHSTEKRSQDEKFRSMFTIAYPDSRSATVPPDGFSLSFVNRVYPSHIQYGADLRILGSSNGLVLCRAILLRQRRYYVCNPLTKKRVSLPPPLLRLSSIDMVWLPTGFVCTNERDSVIYKIICIPKFEVIAGKHFKVEIFSSVSGEWDLYCVERPPGFAWSFSISDHFVTHNGFFYWMKEYRNDVLALSVNTNHGFCGNECRLIDLPDRGAHEYMKHYLGESEGLICYAKIRYEDTSLSVWVLQEDWCLVHKDIKFDDKLTEMVNWLIGRETTMFILLKDIHVLGLSPGDKNVVILAYKEYIWAYDTRTKGYEQLRHPSLTDGNAFSPLASIFTFPLKLRPTILPPWVCSTFKYEESESA